jgi:hypothetical protein
VDEAHGGGGNDGKGDGKSSHAMTSKSMQHTSAVLGVIFDKFNIPDDDSEDSTKDEEGVGVSNRSNQTSNGQSKKNGKRYRELNLLYFTMRLIYVGRMKEVNMSDLDLHDDASVVGKEALLFKYFDREVTVSSYDPDGEKMSMKMVSAALGYVIPEMRKTVILLTIKASLYHNWNTNF